MTHPPARRTCVVAFVAALALGACAAPKVEGPVSASPVASTPGAATPATSAPAATAEPSPSSSVGVQLTQVWATAELTDVRTGQRFRIADLVAGGRVVFIETMAIWCTNCRRQQADVVVALGRLDPARVTWIGLDVDPSEVAADLADYSRTLGFDWPFVVARPDVARALAADFGDQVLSPPSTPIIVIGTDGQVTLTEFGHKSVDRIVQLAVDNGA